MKYVVSIEGQMIPMPAEIATDDGKIKAALVPLFPGAANSKIIRSNPQDDTILVTVVKKAGDKGAVTGNKSAVTGDKGLLPIPRNAVDLERAAMLLEKLEEAPSGENAVVALSREVKDIDAMFANLNPEEELLLDDRIDAIIREGKSELAAIACVQKALNQTEAVPMPELVKGF